MGLSWLKRLEQTRETREGWPLLTVVTEANGDSRTKHEMDPVLGRFEAWQYNRFLSCLGCSGWPSAKYFFPQPKTISLHLSPLPSKMGRQSCLVACFLILCIWYIQWAFCFIVCTTLQDPVEAKTVFISLCDCYSETKCASCA